MQQRVELGGRLGRCNGCVAGVRVQTNPEGACPIRIATTVQIACECLLARCTFGARCCWMVLRAAGFVEGRGAVGLKLSGIVWKLSGGCLEAV